MAQLKMYWLPGTPVPEAPLPDGYSFSNYSCEDDKMGWFECCLNGLLKEEQGAEEAFAKRITAKTDIIPERDLFFLDYDGKHIGTFTVYVHSDSQVGDVHMVAIRSEYRGLGLCRYMMAKAAEKLSGENIKYAYLTTDEFRKAAVKSYLTAGFLPVEYDTGMEKRWCAVLAEHGIDRIMMLHEDGSEYKMIYAGNNTETLPSSDKKIPISGIHHVSLGCNTSEEFVKEKGFYGNVLAMPVVCEWKNGIMYGGRNGIVEIICKSDDAENNKCSGSIIGHYAFASADVDKCINAVRAAGYEVFMEPCDIVIPSVPEIKARIAFCRGPLGEEIEFFDQK